jgi:hypothetical protein
MAGASSAELAVGLAARGAVARTPSRLSSVAEIR